MTAKSLIINADDFGRSDTVNTAIARCAEAGTVTSTTVMVNMPAAEGIALLAKRPDFSIGLHVNLTEGRPTLPTAEVPSLVDGTGQFYPYKPFFKKAMTGGLVRAEVEREIANQLFLLKNIAGRVDHMDSHEHIHLFPPVIRAMLRLAGTHGIKRLRNPERILVSTDAAQPASQRRLLSHFLKHPQALPGLLLKTYQRRLVRRAGMRQPDYALTPQPAISLHDTDRSLAEWDWLCRHMPPGLAELNCHPGHYKGETELFTNPACQDSLAAAQVSLRCFRDL